MGPTGAGKSALALGIAEVRPTVIINADAMQMVSALRILTARPSVAEEAMAEHALYGVLGPEEPTSAAVWLKHVKPAITRAWEEGKLPLLVGGTGMYIQALMEGLAEVPPVPGDVRERLRSMTPEAVRTLLVELDPGMAAQLKPGDNQRNLRALEVFEATGMSLAQWRQATTRPAFPDTRYHVFCITTPREEIYARIDQRFVKMMAQGALEEVRALMALNLPPELPITRAHGVPELMAYLKGEMTLEDAIAKSQQNTRNYAKRQMTWLRHQLPQAVCVGSVEEMLGRL